MKRKYDKVDILAMGEYLFRRQGYHNTGINDILKACGIPKGSFYNFFVSKEDYGIQVLNLYAERTLEFYKESLGDEFLSPYERLKLLYLHSIVDQQKAEDFANGCLLNNLSEEVAGSNPAFAEAIKSQFDGWMREVAAVIKAGQDKGIIRKDHSADKLARLLHGGLFGAFSQMKVTRSGAPLQNIMGMCLEYIKAR